jgi:PST family polysaccharide transporter
MDNFLSLTALQGINYLVPLITFPYLVRVLGVDQFGLFSFIMAIILYAEIITDYGFDLSATKHIALERDNPQKVNEIFSSVIMIKSMMAFIFFFLCCY